MSSYVHFAAAGDLLLVVGGVSTTFPLLIFDGLRLVPAPDATLLSNV